MKKSIYLIVSCLSLVLMSASISGADEVIDIPTTWSSELQTSTRSVIQAGLESEDSVLMTRAMIRARFEERNIVKAQHIVAGTLKEDLPVEPVMNKAYEGIAKEVPAALIVQAMERVRSRYEYAYRLASQLSPEEEAVDKLGYNLAAGLAAGMTREDTEQLVSRIQVRTRTMEQAQLLDLASECLLTARDMVRQGVSSVTATEVVSQGIEKEFSAQEMRSLRSSFMSQSTQGSRESLAKSYANAIQEGRDPQDSAGSSAGATDAVSGNDAGNSSGGDTGNGSGGDSSNGGSDGGSDGDTGSGSGGSGGGSAGGNSGGGSDGSGGSGGSSGSGPGR